VRRRVLPKEDVVALRRRPDEFQGDLWVATGSIAKAPGHVFYERLNALLREAEFDRFVEDLVAPYYASGGRPGIAPGVHFRMLFVGYFEGIDSQRGIAWHRVASRGDAKTASRCESYWG
jgi:hypothetical protein